MALTASNITKQATRFIGAHAALASLLVVIIILALGAVVVILPKMNQLQDVGLTAREERQAARDNLQTELQALIQARAKFNSISQEQYAVLETALPSDRDVAQLISDMPIFIQRQGFGLGQIDIAESTYSPPEGQQGAGAIRRLDINITVAGIDSYDKLTGFLAAVEDSMRILDLTSVSYVPSTSTYSLVLTTYYSSAAARSAQ